MERLIELCDKLDLNNYEEWETLVLKYFTHGEIALIRKNARLGLINEVQFIKTRAEFKIKYLGFDFLRGK